MCCQIAPQSPLIRLPRYRVSRQKNRVCGYFIQLGFDWLCKFRWCEYWRSFERTKKSKLKNIAPKLNILIRCAFRSTSRTNFQLLKCIWWITMNNSRNFTIKNLKKLFYGNSPPIIIRIEKRKFWFWQCLRVWPVYEIITENSEFFGNQHNYLLNYYFG